MRAYEEVAEFIACREPREVAEFRPSAEARQRVIELLGREKISTLTSEERRELDHRTCAVASTLASTLFECDVLIDKGAGNSAAVRSSFGGQKSRRCDILP